MWSPGNVTFHPMRDYAEWKNNLPIAADFVGAGFYSARCNPYFETDIVGATLRGRPETLGPDASSFPQNALRWRFVGTLGNPYFEASAVGATLCGRPET